MNVDECRVRRKREKRKFMQIWSDVLDELYDPDVVFFDISSP